MITIDLWAKEGYLSTPDGNSIYFWGFSSGEAVPAQLPGPHIICKQGEEVTVNLTNTLPEPVSLCFPGQTGVTVNGQPVQPQYENGKLLSFTNHALSGEIITYTFTAEHPGTFLYESGSNPHKQVLMGLYGGVVIHPADYDASMNKTAYGSDTDTAFDREYLLIFAQIDPDFHHAVEQGKPSHGNHTRVIALDGRLLRNGEFDRSYQRFTVSVNPGQTYDQIFQWKGLNYSSQNPIPTTIPNLRNMGIGDAGWTFWSGSPYLGEKADIPQSVQSLNEFGEYYFMLHSHSEPQLTNWGEFPGGLMTMIAIYSSLNANVGVL